LVSVAREPRYYDELVLRGKPNEEPERVGFVLTNGRGYQ
jgi:hypothetical protein